MISYLSGKIKFKTDKCIILDVNGVGYKIFLSQKTLAKIIESGNLELFCFLNVRETALDLYGFLTKEELDFFEILENIRGVGPKAALEISSLGPLEKIKKSIEAQDEKIFEEISGIGRKKAQTIILELSGKIKELYPIKKSKEGISEPEQALINLGFSGQQAKEALSQVPKDIKDEEKIKQGLKILGK